VFAYLPIKPQFFPARLGTLRRKICPALPRENDDPLAALVDAGLRFAGATVENSVLLCAMSFGSCFLIPQVGKFGAAEK
jgi:hypothetical protein